MKILAFFLVLCLALQSKALSLDDILNVTNVELEDLPVATNFEVEKYMGHWYEISSVPFIADFYCICSRTTYKIDPTNSTRVIFDEYCRMSYTWAPIVHSGSIAEIDPVENAKWTNVNGVGTLVVKADYYIIDFEPNYQWALIGARNRASLYVLAREKTMSDDVYATLLAKATSLNFDVSKLEKNKQICSDAAFLSF